MEKRRFFGEPSSEGSFATLRKIFEKIPQTGLIAWGGYLAAMFIVLLLVEALVRSM